MLALESLSEGGDAREDEVMLELCRSEGRLTEEDVAVWSAKVEDLSGHPGRALAILQDAVRSLPESTWIIYPLIALSVKLVPQEETMKIVAHLLERFPEPLETRMVALQAYLEMGRATEARAVAEKIESSTPKASRDHRLERLLQAAHAQKTQ